MNGVIDMINLFRDSMFQSSRISCLAMSTRFPDETMGSGESIRKGCTELFKPHEVSLSEGIESTNCTNMIHNELRSRSAPDGCDNGI